MFYALVRQELELAVSNANYFIGPHITLHNKSLRSELGYVSFDTLHR